MKVPVFAFLFLLLHFCAYAQSVSAIAAQDTILLNSGQIIVTNIMDTSGADITVIKPNSRRHKKIEISKEAIFSIRFGSTGKEDIYYTYDTLIGNDFTVDEVRKFIAGEQDAQRGYHAIGISIAAFAVGFASGATFGGDIFSFVPPFLFEGIMTYPVIHVRHRTVKDLKIANTDPYLYGYYLVASNKRMLRSLLWGGIGIAGGIIANIEIINRTQ